VRYAYEVAGAAFKSDRVGVGGKHKPAELVQKYPPGAEVRVFYNPNKPATAVLAPGGRGLQSLLVIAAAFIVFGWVVGSSSYKTNDTSQNFSQIRNS